MSQTAPAPPPRAPASLWPVAALTDPESRVAAVRQAWFEDGRRVSGGVHDQVLGSWLRCLQAGLRPDRAPVFQPVARKKAAYLEDRDHVLLKAARAPFTELEAALAQGRCKAMLTDRDGVLLRATAVDAGDSALLRAASRPGVQLGELLVGTNAPSLSARLGQASVVGIGEHFYESMGRVRCVAAPIRNRRGSVVAVLDLTLEDRPFGFDAAWLVASYAGVIEDRLRIAQTRQQVLLRLHPAAALLATPAAGLMAVDGQGRIAWISDLAGALLGLSPAQASRQPAEAVLGLGIEAVLALTCAPSPTLALLPSGLRVWVQAEFRPLGEDGPEEMPYAGALSPSEGHARPPASTVAAAATEPTLAGESPPAGPEPTLAQLNHRAIERTLALCGGNLSRAARLLGVSRGLMYRRLREQGARDGAS